jgi:hypothetical protein
MRVLRVGNVLFVVRLNLSRRINMSYFLIYPGEMGVDIDEFSKEEVVKELESFLEDMLEIGFCNTFPGIIEGKLYGLPANSAVLIKGEVVVPKVKRLIEVD